MAARPSRKLAVILHADVVGSTQLVQRDELAAHERIQDSFRRFSRTIQAYSGITHEIRGDALVAEFPRASDAVIAAIAFQISNTCYNAKLEDDIQPQLRIGISLGEVIVADSTVTGAGIVLAQRLEQLASPGGVVVQGSVSETVPTRLPFAFDPLGEQTLKGFDQPVRAFTVLLKPGERIPSPESGVMVPDSAAKEVRERLALDLPDRPSIVVLPFTNMSSDLEQEYFSDGITEDIISELSRFRELFVIARNSSFTFKEKNIDVSEVASKLGVQYVVEGSVRKAANRVRITAQLVDATSASHIWSDRYDRELEDIFAIQDEVVAAIVSALPNQIRQAELARPPRATADIRAYDLVLHASPQGLATREDAIKAITLLEQALEIEPNYAAAHSWLSLAYTMEWDYGLIPKPEAVKVKIIEHARRAVELDQTDCGNYQVLSDHCLFILNDLTEARVHADRALQLNSNATSVNAWRGYIYNCDGESEKAMELCARAIRLDPLAHDWVMFLQGVVCFDAGQYDQAIYMFLTSNWEEKWPHLAASYALTGQIDRAQEIAKRTRQVWHESSRDDLDERIRELVDNNGFYTHGNHDGSFEEGFVLAGFIDKKPH